MKNLTNANIIIVVFYRPVRFWTYSWGVMFDNARRHLPTRMPSKGMPSIADKRKNTSHIMLLSQTRPQTTIAGVVCTRYTLRYVSFQGIWVRGVFPHVWTFLSKTLFNFYILNSGAMMVTEWHLQTQTCFPQACMRNASYMKIR